jgi:hypothetical protein
MSCAYGHRVDNYKGLLVCRACLRQGHIGDDELSNNRPEFVKYKISGSLRVMMKLSTMTQRASISMTWMQIGISRMKTSWTCRQATVLIALL